MITQAATDIEKCLGLWKTEVTVKDEPDAKELIMADEDIQAGKVGEVRFDNVSFCYQGNERGESGGLNNVSFTVPAGKMVAIVGASGMEPRR